MGFFPQLIDMPAHNDDGVGGMHIYIPWWLEKDRSLPFSSRAITLKYGAAAACLVMDLGAAYTVSTVNSMMETVAEGEEASGLNSKMTIAGFGGHT